MKRIAFILFVIVNCQLSIVNLASAQEKFTERLQRTVQGQGTVRLHHDADIEALLYGRRSLSPVAINGQKTKSSVLAQLPDTARIGEEPLPPLTGGRKVRMTGYRVQVYAGGNSRDAKNKAYQMEGLVRSQFPEQPVYTRFVNPRWICHVGDFQTREEALELLSEMRRTGKFPEAITVKCKITTFVYE